MSTVAAISPQWIGIAAASAIVVILLVVLLLRRRSEGAAPKQAQAAAPDAPFPPSAVPGPAPAAQVPPSPPAQPATFLDEPLSRGFDTLGKQTTDRPALGTVVLPKDMRPVPTPAAPGPPLAPAPLEPALFVDTSIPPAPEPAPAPPTPYASSPEPAEPSVPGEPEAAPSPSRVAPAAHSDETAPLSDVIVTTNQQEVDLTDPDVREMLTQLVTDEMALAAVYKSQGQVLDAILQLTEAEKACQALGDAELSARIKTMMDDLQP